MKFKQTHMLTICEQAAKPFTSDEVQIDVTSDEVQADANVHNLRAGCKTIHFR